MPEWERSINGQYLRSMIFQEETMEILIELNDMVKKILSWGDKVYYYNDFEELSEHLRDDIEMGEEKLLDYIEEEINYQSFVGYVDSKLEWFYDLCDRERIWVTV